MGGLVGFAGLVRPGAGTDAQRAILSGRAQGRTRVKLRHAGAQRTPLRTPPSQAPLKTKYSYGTL